MSANPPSLRSYGVALCRKIDEICKSGPRVRDTLQKRRFFHPSQLFFTGMICEKCGGFPKRPVNIGWNGAFLQKGGFQKNDVKPTIDYNLSSEVWETQRHEH
ncbi:MAG: hypothetical protein JWR26_1657 [Pedosphaera sp.]|nr:hypothetical protein [Pedosphaera sp.]